MNTTHILGCDVTQSCKLCTDISDELAACVIRLMTFSLNCVNLTYNRHIVNVTGYKQDVVSWSLGPQKGTEQTDNMKQRVLSVTQQMYTVSSITVYGRSFSNCTTLLHALSNAHNRRVCKNNITLVCNFTTT